MRESLDASLVRIRTTDGRVVGAGFLVGKRHILTCVHVVSQALGLLDSPLEPPQGAVSLDFPLVSPHTLLTASVVQWCPPLSDGRGDIAGLELQGDPPAGTEVVRFAPAEDVWEHPFRAIGFPAGYDDGVWATGRLLGRQATDWVLIEDVKAQGFAVAAGFSGTPVWDTQAQGVVGMVVAASRPTDTKTAFVIPLDVLATAWPLITVPQGTPRNPYKGLRPFTQRDADDFFGREAAVEKLADLVMSLVTDQPASSNTRLLTILGPSGAGKSSLVMAGLLPQLQHGMLPGSDVWLSLDPMVPGKHPIESLVLTLAAQLPERSFSSLREDLEDEAGRGLHQLCMHLLNVQRREQPGARVLLLVDQCEELFTQTESEGERQRFIQLLLTACSEPRGPLVVLFTLRADFYDRPMQYPDLFRLIDTQHLSLLSIEPDDLRRVVEQPAALADVQVTFEGDLVNRLLADVQGQVGALPLLQFTLDQLFQRRSGRQLTLSAYRELGGVKGALTKQVEETYAALPSEEHRKLARILFLRLIDPGMTEQDTTRRRAALSEFSLPDPTQTRLLRETINAFIAARLLTTNEVAGTTTVEVSHEALIREWARLSGWLRDTRDDIHLQKVISEDAAAWERRRKPADRLYRGSQLKEAQAWARRNIPSGNEVAFLHASASNRRRVVVMVMAVLLLVFSSTGIAAWLLTHQSPRPQDPTRVTNANGDGLGSLSWSIANAPTGSTITFDASLSGRTIFLTKEDLVFNRNLRILGPGAHTLSISGGTSNHRVRVVPGVSVAISGLTFKDSHFNCSDSNTCPGLIFNQGTLALTNSIVSNNVVRAHTLKGDGLGAGIYNDSGGMLTLTNSIVSGNSSDDGGGIFNAYNATLTLEDSIVSGNSARFFQGGGIDNGGSLTLTNSTVSGNVATGTAYDTGLGKVVACGSGGGIDYAGTENAGPLTLTNSTISGNSAPQNGGGIDIPNSFLPVVLTFCTLFSNTASVGSDIAVYESSNTQTINLRIGNSIVVGDPAHPNPDIAGGVVTSEGYNLFRDNSGATFDPKAYTQHLTDKTVKDLASVFATPVGLRENSGLTQTYALGPGSPAIDAIPLSACHINGITTDQRGLKRPDENEQYCDIGAYEYVDSST